MSTPSDSDGGRYFAPDATRRAEIREKGSRFLALLLPVDDEAGATAALERIRDEYRDATHHCWARRLGDPPRERSADDGEPAGTAGAPILQVLRGAEVSDVLLVVVRWFGGTKLGKGGLARAYAEAARKAVDGAGRVERVERVELQLSLPYGLVGAAKRLLDAPGRRLLDEQYGEAVRMRLSVPLPDLGELEAAVADLGPKVSLRRIGGQPGRGRH